MHDGISIEDACLFPPALMNEGAELLIEAGGTKRDLTRVFVDVEHPALSSGCRSGFEIEYRRIDSAEMDDSGEGEAAEAGADDCDGGVVVHGGFLRSEWGVLDARDERAESPPGEARGGFTGK